MVMVGLVWSGAWVAGKFGVSEVPPLALSAVRFLIAGALLLALARLTRARVPWSRWPALLALGATGIFAYNALVFLGLVLAPAADGGLIVPTFSPVLAAVLAALFAGERLTRPKVAGLAASILGVALIVAAGGGGEASGAARLQGDLLILGGAFCWAVYTVLGKSVLRSGSALGVTAAASFLGGLMLVPTAILEGGLARIPSWSASAWLAIGYLVVFATIIGFVGFYQVVVRLGASRAATTTYFVPIGTVLLAAIFLGERVAPLQLVGGALTLAGMRIASARAGEGLWLRRIVGV